MVHPTVLECAARTGERTRKSLEVIHRPGAWDGNLMEQLSNSRDAIAYSRDLLARINGGTAK